MSGTISTVLTSSYTLSVNPTTITQTGGVEVTGAAEAAIVGPSPSAWTVLNEGTLTSAEGYGVLLHDGGSVTNTAGALIKGGIYYDPLNQGNFGAGVSINGAAGTVVNSGTIEDQEPARYYGYIGTGIALGAGGRVTNTKGGAIIGGAYGIANDATAAATVTNAGTILASSGDGVFLDGGDGNITNKAGGTIGGKLFGVYAPDGGVTIANAGSIAGGEIGVFADSGNIDNIAGGVITGGVDLRLDGGTVVNAGSITEVSKELGSGGGYSFEGLAVSMGGGGRVTNLAGGVIAGGSPATDGILAGGTGVAISGGAGTVVNAGTISGGAEAVVLAAGYANLVVDDPGAVFNGTVNGGNAIGGPVASTLELAAGGPGTLYNLNIQFIDFSDIVVNKDADWEILSGSSSRIVAGQTLTDAGTLFYAGNPNIVGSDVSGKIALAGGQLELGTNLTIAAGGVLTGSGSVVALDDSGISVASGGTLGGGSGMLVLQDLLDGSIAGAIDGNEVEFAGGDVSLAKGVHGSVHTIAVVNALLFLDPGLGSFVYHGEFDVTGGGTINLSSNDATLAGPASFLGSGLTAEITGTSRLTLDGPTQMGSVAIEGSELLVNSGSLTENGAVTLDNSASLGNAKGGTWNITSDSGIAPGSGATGSITNVGTFEKTAGSGTSVIAADFVNNGTIIATSGTLDFTGGFTNHGRIIENGGTVIVGPEAGPALFNQYVAGIAAGGAVGAVPAAAPDASPAAVLAAPHTA